MRDTEKSWWVKKEKVEKQTCHHVGFPRTEWGRSNQTCSFWGLPAPPVWMAPPSPVLILLPLPGGSGDAKPLLALRVLGCIVWPSKGGVLLSCGVLIAFHSRHFRQFPENDSVLTAFKRGHFDEKRRYPWENSCVPSKARATQLGAGLLLG